MSAGVYVNSHWQALTSLNEKEMCWRGKTWPCIFHELCTSGVCGVTPFWSYCSLGHIYTVLLSLCVMHLCLCLWQTSLPQSYGTPWQSKEQVRVAGRLPVRHAVCGGRWHQHFQPGGSAAQDSGCEVLHSQHAVPQGRESPWIPCSS